MHVIRPLTLILTAFTVLSACNNANSDNGNSNLADEGTEQEGFAAFYNKFHQDSLFQISRISWPLNGNYVQDSAGAAKDIRYELDEWVMHRSMVGNPEFVQQIEPVTESLYFEEIKARAGNYKIERRFAMLDGGWHLIYYRLAGI